MDKFLWPLISCAAVALVLYLADKAKRREEKRLPEGNNFKVQSTKSVRIFFLFISLACIACMVAALFSGLEPINLLISEGVLLLLSALPILVYLNIKFNYYIVSDEKIIHMRLFGKNKVIEYGDMAYMQCYCMGETLGVFDSNDNILIDVGRLHVGTAKLTALLMEKGITLK